MRFHQIAAVALWTAMVLSAQAGRRLVPIQPVEEMLVTTRADMTERAIRQGASDRGWVPQVVDANLVKCRLYDKYSVAVDVQHTEDTITVRFESTTLPYDPSTGTIHPTYNRWVANLVKSIRVAAMRIGPGPYPPPPPPPPPNPTNDCSKELADIQGALSKNQQELEGLKGRQQDLAGRQQELERRLQWLEDLHNQGTIPDEPFEIQFMEIRKEMDGIDNDIEGIKGSIPGIQTSLDGIQKSLEGIQDCLKESKPDSLREVKDSLEQIKKTIEEIQDSLAKTRGSR